MALTKAVAEVDALFAMAASAAYALGASVDLSALYPSAFHIDYAPTAETAATVAAKAIVQLSSNTSGDEHWSDYYTVSAGLDTAASEVTSGTEAAGATLIEVASTTGLALQDAIFFLNTTLGNSEWARIVALSANTSITVEDALTYAQTDGTIYNKAYSWVVSLPLWANRSRILYFGPTGPASCAWRSRISKVTAI
jgi:hypothetical protein